MAWEMGVPQSPLRPLSSISLPNPFLPLQLWTCRRPIFDNVSHAQFVPSPPPAALCRRGNGYAGGGERKGTAGLGLGNGGGRPSRRCDGGPGSRRFGATPSPLTLTSGPHRQRSPPLPRLGASRCSPLARESSSCKINPSSDCLQSTQPRRLTSTCSLLTKAL